MKAVFFDKDGTLVQDRPYNVDPSRIEFTPGAVESIGRLARAGYALFVVSNQPGVALGLFSEAALSGVWRTLDEEASHSGAKFAGFYHCPHHPMGVVSDFATECGCRKPKPGLLLKAAREHGIDLSRSWMIGDILNDVEAGIRAGCRTVLIDNGNETEWVIGPERVPDFMATGLLEATEWILKSSTEDA